MTTQEFEKAVAAFVLAYRTGELRADSVHMDNGYDEWLEENMDKFEDEDAERDFANWKSEDGMHPRNCDDVDEVDALWKEYSNRGDGGPGSGNHGHSGVPGQRGGSAPNGGGIKEGKDISATYSGARDINSVIKAQGFDGLPRVVSSEEFYTAKKNAKVYGYRGYSAPDSEALKMYQDQLYTGKWYVDCSVGTAAYGQGMYMQGVTDLDDETGIRLSKMIAEGYGKSRQGEAFNVEEMAMSKDAKGIALYRHKGSLTEAENYSDFYLDYMQKNATGEWSDIGVYAAAKGYDYIYFYDERGTQEIVVLNRTKLIIKGK